MEFFLKQLVRLFLNGIPNAVDFFQTAFHMVSSQCDQRQSFIPPQVLDLAFPFDACSEFLVISFLQPVEGFLTAPLMAADPSIVSTALPVQYCVQNS